MDKEAICLLHLNIERERHLDAVKRLLAQKHPDIFCLNEVPESLAETLAGVLGFVFHFEPMGNYAEPDGRGTFKVGIMIAWDPSLTIIEEPRAYLYNHHVTDQVIWVANDPASSRRVMLVVTVQKNGVPFRIGTTHFTWTPDGSASDVQREDMKNLLSIIEKFDDEHGIVFCGDFNAPRGGEIFGMMSAQYRDNLPLTVTTTLDQELHRAAPIVLAVDNIFSSKEYSVNMNEPIFGVSDHCALIADITRSV